MYHLRHLYKQIVGRQEAQDCGGKQVFVMRLLELNAQCVI